MSTRIGVVAVTVMFGIVAQARAQELAGTFDQLRVLIAPGQTITVVDTTGKAVKGQLVALSPTSLRLAVGGATRELMERDVDMIRQRRPDSLANGAKIGFGVGLGFGALGAVAIIASDEEGEWGYALVGAALYAGLGAGIGVGIDALIEKDQSIYARRQTGGTSVRLAPIVGRDRRGVQMAIRF